MHHSYYSKVYNPLRHVGTARRGASEYTLPPDLLSSFVRLIVAAVGCSRRDGSRVAVIST